MDRANITPEIVRALLDYDPATGALSWLPRTPDVFCDDDMMTADVRCAGWNNRYAGKPALMGKTRNGYLGGRIFDINVLAHRIAFAHCNGFFPEEVDHLNGDRTDNRAANLRAATKLENRRNQKRRDNPLPTGIYWNRNRRRFVAQIGVNYGTKYLGSFSDLDAAVAARRQAERHYGFHPNHGRARP
jgi:hypothetical protein